MIRRQIFNLAVVIVSLSSASLLGQPIKDWRVPASWEAPRAAGIRPLSIQSDIAEPLPFIPVTPCRQYDSRNTAPLANGTPLTVGLSGAPCGIPAAAGAVSVNITVFSISGAGGNGVFKVGISSPPTTAWINYPPSETQRANAGVVATDGSGNIVVEVNQGGGSVNFTVDVNGYYASTPATATNGFTIVGSAQYAITGATDATGQNDSGIYGLASNTIGTTNGVFGLNLSAADTATGVFGVAAASSGKTVGVWGRTLSTSDNSGLDGDPGPAGVYGEAVGTGRSFGVHGHTTSLNSLAAGVFGTSDQDQANGGEFANFSSGIYSYVSFSSFGFLTFGEIFGGSLNISGAPKNFVSPDPADPSKEIKYASVEAPTVDVYFRGTAALANGYARIEVPDHFRMTAREGTYMTTLTPVGRSVVLNVQAEGPEGIVVRGDGNVAFHYVVYAERAEIEGYEPVQKNVHFTPAAMEKLHMLEKLPPSTKALLIKNGTLNPDGTYNEETARAMGWTIPRPSAADISVTRSAPAK